MIEADHDAGSLAFAGSDTLSTSRSSAEALSAPDSQYLTLARTVENEIIPRLLLAHRFDTSRSGISPIVESTLQDIAAFTKIVNTRESEEIHAHVTALIQNGMSLNAVFLDLLAPTARHFGDLWLSDTCSFTDVTLALCKLQRLLRDLGHDAGAASDARKIGYHALLATVPSNQHTFGVLMVEEFFRQAGWNVLSIPAATTRDIIDAVRQDWFSVIGLSMSCDNCAPGVPGLISAIRQKSRNRSIVVLVGGRYFNDNPDQALAFGADATATDARHAVLQTQRIVKAVNRH